MTEANEVKPQSALGFHSGIGGYRDGIGNYMAELDAAGKRFSIKSTDDVGLVIEAAGYARKSGIDHFIILRFPKINGRDNDKPDFDRLPLTAAIEFWDRWKAHLAQAPEFEAVKDLVWIEPTNEIDTWTKAPWLGLFCTALAQLAIDDGYRVLLPGMHPGQPEPAHWDLPGFQAFLKLIEQHPDKIGISLHEGKVTDQQSGQTFNDPIVGFYPHMIGRVEWLLENCRRNGIAAPKYIAISEFSFSYDDMPALDAAMQDLEWASRLYATMPSVRGVFIWNLAGGEEWGGLAEKAQKLIAPVTQLVLTADYPAVSDPDAPAPPPPVTPDPEAETRIYLLRPVDATPQQEQIIQAWARDGLPQYGTDGRHTVTYSHTDGIDAISRGAAGSLLIIINGESIGTGLTEAWVAANAPQVASRCRYTSTEPDPDPDPDPPPAGVWASPVGEDAERASGALWGQGWADVNPYGTFYHNAGTGRDSYHTGADLNKNTPTWDSDRGANVYSCGAGTVIHSLSLPIWGNVVVIRHEYAGRTFFSRSAHLGIVDVVKGQSVTAASRIGTVGRDLVGGPYHLHYDISPSDALISNPGDWAGSDYSRIERDYTEPRAWLQTLIDGKRLPGQVDIPPTGKAYYGNPVTFSPAIHAPGSDWQWGKPELQAMIQALRLPVKFMTNGSHKDYFSRYNQPNVFELIRVFWQPNQPRTPAEAWAELGGDMTAIYQKGGRNFELLNEPNLAAEGLGIVWADGAEFGAWLHEFGVIAKRELPGIRLWYPGLSPGSPWTNQFSFTDPAWAKCRTIIDGYCMHAYTGITDNAAAAAADIIEQVKQTQQYIALDRPLIVSECSVNRGADYAYKADVYRQIEDELQQMPGIAGIVYFISTWDAPAAQAEHGESWLGTSLPAEYLQRG